MVVFSSAVDRGVEVHFVVPHRSDHLLISAAGRAYFTRLLDMGVQVHRYQRGMLHAKTMTVDDAFALLGSANIDVRSYDLNFEINVLMFGPQITGQMRFAQMGYMADSMPLDPAAWRRRSALAQMAENAAALLSPLL
ncbi:MAG: hypothetical protein IT440_12910 [Phycisphaeraceae bacterium]|nr:hypothetical protein [Phycisphaeraceae bacterium]